MAKRKENYMDYIPVRNPEMDFEVGENGLVTVIVEWKGFYYRIAQRFFHKPRVSRIDLDEFGSYVWLQIDGVRDVYALHGCLVEHFGEMEKSLSRLMKFLEILRDHKFIYWKGKEDAK